MTDKDRFAPGAKIRVNRRGFLKLAGTTGFTLVLPACVLDKGAGETIVDSFDALLDAAPADLTHSVNLLRPSDLLNLKIDFLNLAPRKRCFRPPALIAPIETEPSYLVVTLPGQHVLEERSGENEPAPPLPVKAYLSENSRLVFRVPHEALPLDYLVESLLRWSEFELVLRPHGLPMCKPLRETAIVFPSRLSFVPDERLRVSAAHEPRVAQGRTELWRADLSDTSLRAIWTPDHQDAGCDALSVEPAPSFDAPLQGQTDRLDIAISARRASPAHPSARPVDVRGLTLSPLGAWADIRGEWNPPVSNDLVEWENRSTMGRDHRVKLARVGYLYPWGNEAVLIELTERKILPSPAGPDAAYLRYRLFLVITQPVRVYPDPDTAPDLGHPNQPLRTIEFVTRKTPTLDAWSPRPAAPAVPDGSIDGHGRRAFWPKVGGTEFRFALETRDWTGKLSSTEVTAIFIGREDARNPAVLADVERAYADEISSNTGTPVPRPGLRTSPFRGQPVAFAVENERDDTTAETGSITFSGQRRPSASAGDLDWPFSAVMETATVRLPSISRMAGFTEHLEVSYDPRFEPAHPENNPAELFLRVTKTALLDFGRLGKDKSGGVATPNLRIGAVSRSTGPVGDDVDGLVEGNFEPSRFFPDDAKLLGGVKMGDVLEKSKVIDTVPFCGGATGAPRQSTPKFGLSYVVDDQGSKRVCSVLDWETTKLKNLKPIFEVGPKSCLRLQTTVCFGGTNDVDFTQQRGRITDIKFIIPKTILFHFEYVDFERVAGRPLRVDVGLEDWEFLDALKFIGKFVDAVKKWVKGLFGKDENGGGGIGDYFDYSITAKAVKLFFLYKLPDFKLGTAALSDMRLAFGVEFPLFGDDGLLMIFEFSSRKDPFGVAIAPFGGGGYFGIGFVTDELRRIEGAIEFGGRFPVGIWGAEGEVYVMAGIYYGMKVDRDGNKRQELAAYLRAGGSLQVIKLIRVSVEFYLVLMYIDDESSPDHNSLCGEATVVVEVSIAFFSASVDLTFRKCFKGEDSGNGGSGTARTITPSFIRSAIAESADPLPIGEEPRLRFRDAVNGVEGWTEYWQAFAV